MSVQSEPVALAASDEAAPPAATFQTDQVLTIVGGHFVHDTTSAFLTPLLPLLQMRLGTNYALTGNLFVLAQLPSILNPLIGYLADRISVRYFVILAPGITATMMALLGIAPNYLSMALLMLAAGLSIAAFHAPAPAMVARIAGQRVGTGMSLFMAGGELGRSVGPIVVAAAIAQWGLEGIWRLAFVGWAATAILYWRLRAVAVRPNRAETGSMAAAWPLMRRLFPPLALLLLTRVMLLAAITTYLPSYITDVAQAQFVLAAAAVSILQFAGMVGTLFAGTLSDRFGRQRVLLALMMLAPIAMLAFAFAPMQVAVAVPLLIALGATAIAPTPVLLALVQDFFPTHRAFANGLFIGMNFVLTAAGVWGIGLLADAFGLASAFRWAGVVALLAVPALWLVPTNTTRPNATQ